MSSYTAQPMPQICGWINTAPSGEETHPTISAMFGSECGFHAVGGDNKKASSVLAVSSTSDHCSLYSNRGIQAAVIGTPRWHDVNLSEIASQVGHARALFEAYTIYGHDLMRHIRGSFSIALLDTEQHSSLFAIDRAGTKPFCYAKTADGGLVFGSSAESVRRHPAIEGTIDLQAVYDYAYFHTIPSPNTIYSQIRKLEPAQCLVGSGEQQHLNYYWQPTFHTHGSESVDSLEEEFKNLLRSAVQHCSPDENTGCFLSGGTDSSTVSGLLSQLSDKPPRAYSIGFSVEGYDELEYARIAAKHFNTDWHYYYVTPDDVVDAIAEIALAYDEPFGNSSAIPALFCARLARYHGTSHLLAGDGGDELFAGNERYAKQKILAYYHLIPPLLRRSILEPLFVSFPASSWTPITRKIRSYITQARLPMPERTESYNFLHREPASRIFQEDFLQNITTGHPLTLLKDTFNRAPSDNLLERMLYMDWKFTLADNDLRKVNRMCELAGITVSYPLLDDELVEFSSRIPPSMHLKGLQLRYFFKHALRDFLPKEIIEKQKHGFGLPFGEWLKANQPLQDLVYANLHSLKQRGIFKQSFVDNLIATHRQGHAAYYGSMLWILTMLEQWFTSHRISP